MREWRKRRAERKSAQRSDRRGESWPGTPTGEAHNLVHEGSIPSLAPPATTSANTSPSPTTGSPRSPTERTGRTGRRQLLKQYTDLRAGGHDDTSAQAQLTRLRSQQQRQAATDAHQRTEQAQVRARLPQAERWLRVNAGVWTDADAWNVACRMVEQDRTLWSAARQGDVVKQLPAPRLPALPPPQPALPIWQGVRRPATVGRVALGAERRVLPGIPEEARQAVHDAVAAYVARRQSSGKL